MLRDQFVTFLETTIVFLLLMNTLSVAAAAYAISMANGMAQQGQTVRAVAVRKANAMISAVWPNGR
jgi:hypothetical protein